MIANTIVFDLGGVFFRFNWQSFFSKLRLVSNRTGGKFEDVLSGRATEEIMNRFNLGEVDTKSFYEYFNTNLGLSWEPEQFKSSLCEVQINEPMVAVLKALQGKAQIVLLSNTNPVHAELILNRYSFKNFFNKVFLSYKIGLVKPDLRIFSYVYRNIQEEGGQVLFVDDEYENLKSAERVGYATHLYTSPKRFLLTLNQELSEGCEGAKFSKTVWTDLK